MDTLSHGLWGSLAFGRASKKEYWLAFVAGVAPDIFSFGLLFMARLFHIGSTPDWSAGPPDPNLIPHYVGVMYNYTHSFVIFSAVYIILLLIFRKPLVWLLAWPLHIAYDIFTHSLQFYPTPFLWPLSEYRFAGISWSNPWIFFSNWIALIVGYSIWRIYRHKTSKTTT